MLDVGCSPASVQGFKARRGLFGEFSPRPSPPKEERGTAPTPAGSVKVGPLRHLIAVLDRTAHPDCLGPVRLLLTVVTVGLLLSLTAGCSAKAKAERHLKRADKYFDAGQYPKAEVEYLVALQRQPTNAHAISRLGAIYYEEGRVGRAFVLLTNACALLPNDLDVRLKVASICVSIGKAREAREHVNFVLDGCRPIPRPGPVG